VVDPARVDSVPLEVLLQPLPRDTSRVEEAVREGACGGIRTEVGPAGPEEVEEKDRGVGAGEPFPPAELPVDGGERSVARDDEMRREEIAVLERRGPRRTRELLRQRFGCGEEPALVPRPRQRFLEPPQGGRDLFCVPGVVHGRGRSAESEQPLLGALPHSPRRPCQAVVTERLALDARLEQYPVIVVQPERERLRRRRGVAVPIGEGAEHPELVREVFLPVRAAGDLRDDPESSGRVEHRRCGVASRRSP
jgi:hypothetical protein